MNAVARYGVFVMAASLIGIGLGAVFFPTASSVVYGVAVGEPTWIAATGLRDLALGLVLIAIWIRHRESLRLILAISLVLPVGDAILVLANGQPLQNTLPHVVGATFCAALVWWTRPSLAAARASANAAITTQ